MKRLIVLFAGIGLVAAGLASAPARASSQTDDVEVRLLAMINAGRGGQGKGAEVMHAGLRLAAQQHSADMSARNSMDHNGFPGRINTANPDPAESNGPPDNGFNGSACENVAWYQPGGSATTAQIAQKFYDLWFNSPPHHDCMFDAYGYRLNVAGTGIYYNSAQGKWWATFDSAYDSTPPTASPPPTPSPTPKPTPSPSPTPSPTPTPPLLKWNRVQQTGAGVAYTGTWVSISNASASGGSYRRSNVTGSTAKFVFTGTGVRWIGIMSTTGGIANITIDGVRAGSVDQYAAATGFNRTLFQRTGLSAGAHTLQVSVSGTRNARATDQKTWIDAFDYYS
jgi:uncharacterized protein YkwD